jgi:LPXTG-site transpeptidase (sortase) family protein
MKRSDAIRFVLLRSLGNFLLLLSIYGVVATFGPVLLYEAQFQIIKIRGINYKVASAEEVSGGRQGFADVLEKTKIREGQPGFEEVLVGPSEQILIPPDTDFSIVIPKIGATATVFPNVDPENESEFIPVLQKGIAHAKGTVFPGFSGNVYLFAHSTDNWWNVGRYNAVFYLLKNLNKGDDIVVFFENKRHNYVVTELLVMDARDVSQLSRPQSGAEQLVLQTCWPPGTTWKRLVVLASPK